MRQLRQTWPPAALTVLDVLALVTLQGVARRTLAGGLQGDVDRLSADLAATALFAVAAWLGVGLLATAAATAPGVLGAAGARLARAVLPAVIRRVLAGSVGLGVLLAPVAAGAHAAAAHGPTPAPAPTTSQGSLPPPVWPTSTPSPGSGPTSTPTHTTPTHAPTPGTPPPGSTTPGASPTTPASTGPGPTTPAPTIPPPTTTPPTTTPATTTPGRSGPAPATGSSTATVRAGDSLWLLAQRRLGGHADDADVAAYWRSIYRVNRAAIGDDPNLIRPGQHLTLPAPAPKEPTR